MILPIVAYGHPTLKAIAQPIAPDYPELDTLMKDMWETLANSEGVGLAAPQVNKSIRLFIVDGNPFYPTTRMPRTSSRSLLMPNFSKPLAMRSPSRKAASACPTFMKR